MAQDLTYCMTRADCGSGAPNGCNNACDECHHERGNVGLTTPEKFICPSALLMTKTVGDPNGDRTVTWHLEELSKGNYAGNFGKDTYSAAIHQSMWFQPEKAGAFCIEPVHGTKPLVFQENDASMRGVWKMGRGAGAKVKDFKDGTAKTLLVSEVHGWDSNLDARGAWMSATPGGSSFFARTGPNSQINDKIPICEEKIPDTDILNCVEERGAPPQLPGGATSETGAVWAAARSQHPGGVNCSYADASVRFVVDEVDIEIWRAAATRAGGENRELP
jgi:prepilin-type processing-associated H-X9-DG protein